MHQVGSGPAPGLPHGVDTPGLKGIWETAPYLHDGSAATLSDVFGSGDPLGNHGAVQTLSADEQTDLCAYLAQLDDDESLYELPPLVKLTEPVAGAMYAVGGSIPLAVHVADYLGEVALVEFFRGETKLGESTTAPFTCAYEGTTAGEHEFHARVTFAGDQCSTTPPVKVTALAYVPLPEIHVNFQPPGRPVPAGYLADTAEVYGDRGNGRSYGWNLSDTKTRDRDSSLSPDQRYDTYIQMQIDPNPDAVWEIALPNGVYNVHIVAGDSTFTSSNFRIMAENVMVLNASPTTSARWREGTQAVTVNDGRLTVKNGAGATNNKICFIDITPTAAAAIATKVSLEAIAGTTAEDGTAPALIGISRQGATADPLPVAFACSGTAEAGADFPALPGIFVIPAGSAMIEVPIAAVADGKAEGTESLTLSLLPGEGYLAGASSTATIEITDPPYDVWRFSHFNPLERTNEALSGFEAAPGGEGKANGLVYALGGTPGDWSWLPQGAESEGRLALSFTRPVGGLPGIRYLVESCDLATGARTILDEATFTITPNGDDTETVVAPAPFGYADSPAQFLRLRVEEDEP
jgi:hypothetical protein